MQELERLFPVFQQPESTGDEMFDRIVVIDARLKDEDQATRDAGYADLLALIAETEFNGEFDSGAEVVYEFAAHAAQERGELCDARHFAQTLLGETAFDHWRRIADEILSHVDAPVQGCPVRLTGALADRPIDPYCQLRLSGRVEAWPQMCEILASKLAGRDLRVLSPVDSPAFAQLQAAAAPDNDRLMMVAIADGGVTDAGGDGDTAPRFGYEGMLLLRLLDGSTVLHETQLSGATGWRVESVGVGQALAESLGEQFELSP